MPDYVDQQFHHDPLDTQDLLAAARKGIVDMRAGLLEMKDDDMQRLQLSSRTQNRIPSRFVDVGDRFSTKRSSFLQTVDTYTGSMRSINMQGSISIGVHSCQSLTNSNGDTESVVHALVDSALGIMAVASAAELPVGAVGGGRCVGSLAGPPHAVTQIVCSTYGYAE
eukprot:CAMPEP_0172770700 /NCGR_PEP_ID=MMETSP1074-20121228/189180_1 /TAXON_ID=2916 /ORGANISM="Ceratium fusus, Strain PA161109" /LENGTH=166 /DNA_ID=CAMNT_0013606509 /DNA_START=15 /DNA_END=512 /DNA_ORIENTATION=-